MKKTELAVRLTNACTCVSEAEDILTEIDSKFGDADHGLTMTKIAKAISQAVAEADGIQSMLDAAAMAVMMLNGGSAVPLWNTWLDGMQEAAPASDEVDVAGLKAMFAGAFTALDEMSGAKVGDKTMMDALIPASQAIAAYAGDSESERRRRPRGFRSQQAVCLQIRPGQKLWGADHRHPRRRGHFHGLLFQGPLQGQLS